MADLVDFVGRRRRAVRVRQVLDQLSHLLSFVPALYVVGAILLVQGVLWLDRRLIGNEVPDLVETTVASARSVFAVLAGGLITAITLLLSMALITVQLASSQFSPRTLRDWIGDRVLQHTVGLALGSTVFALLALRSTRSLGEDDVAIVPHITVLVALVLGITSLFMVVRSVDHIANSVRVGAVAHRIAQRTTKTIDATQSLRSGEDPVGVPTSRPARDGDLRPPDGAEPIETPNAGWIQQIDVDTILRSLPEHTHAVVAVPIGAFAPHRTPLVWLSPAPAADHPCRTEVLEAFALGDTRTLQQDVAFGLTQLTDIAVRALSPGVNDPGTAVDIVVQIGDLLLRIWEQPDTAARIGDTSRSVELPTPTHDDYLRTACEAIRRYASSEPEVSLALVRVLSTLRAETVRRSLPGPLAPVDRMIESIRSSAESERWSAGERAAFAEAVDRTSTYGNHDVERNGAEVAQNAP